MNADIVPMAVLMSAIALSWPEFIGMFRLRPKPSVGEASFISMACAAGIGSIGLAIQHFGMMTGGFVCVLGVLAGQFLVNDARTARRDAFLSAGCIAVAITTIVPLPN